MRIVVCIKQSVSGEINPFDACCYEAALQISGAEVTLLSMGPEKTKDFLLNLTRLGANRAILLCDNTFAGADTLATAYTLSLAVKKLSPDLVLCGRQTMDGDTAQVGPELSVFLDYPLITNVMSLSADQDGVRCIDRLGEETFTQYPALLTLEKINTLRLPSIRSKPSPVEVWTAKDLDADLSRCGLKGSPTRVLKTFENNTDRRRCKFISLSDLDNVIKKSLEKKVIEVLPPAEGTTLKKVWVVGESPLEAAKTVSDDITVIPLTDWQDIADKIKAEKPNAVLWGSDGLSKKTAAMVAARLNLGLCADCVTLETDGQNLFMYRPAFSGSIIAKIKSLTTPCMATIRTTEPDQKDVIIGVGMGAKNSLEKARRLAEKYNGDVVASRLMVDHDFIPYEAQVGLTGKTVSPRVYIALGISGAVHHIAGIRKSDTIIAINSNPNAPIFQYSDYGIVADLDRVEWTN
ncbi:MAG: FAD-binding protein [Acutalibacteraceae bacterium]